MLDKVFNVTLESKQCCTVLDVREDSLLLDIWDYYETDTNQICDSKNMDVIIDTGYGPSCSAPILGDNMIAVGYGYEAILENGGVVVKIYSKDNGEVLYEYANTKALGCDEMYSDEEGAIWASFWGENRIIKIQENQSFAYECEMSGFSGILKVNKEYIYVGYEYDCCRDRIFRMEYSNGRYINAKEMKVSMMNEQGDEEIIEIEKISSEHGHVVGLIKENVIGVLDI